MDIVQARIVLRHVEASRSALRTIRSELSGVRKDAIRSANESRMANAALNRSYSQLATGVEQSARRQRTALQSVVAAHKGMQRGMGSLGPLMGIGAGFGLYQGYRGMMDAYQQKLQFQATMGLMVGKGRVGMMDRGVAGIANKWGAPIQGMRDGAMGIAGIPGISPEKALQTLEAFTKIGIAGGSSGDEIAGALRQLKQSLGSGTVQGDELRIIAEQMPILQKVLAEGGTSIGAIKAGNQSGKPMAATELLDMFIAYAARKDVGEAAGIMSKSPLAEETRLRNKVNAEFANLGQRVAPQMASALSFLTGNLGLASGALIAFTVALGVGSARNALGGLLGGGGGVGGGIGGIGKGGLMARGVNAVKGGAGWLGNAAKSLFAGTASRQALMGGGRILLPGAPAVAPLALPALAIGGTAALAIKGIEMLAEQINPQERIDRMNAGIQASSGYFSKKLDDQTRFWWLLNNPGKRSRGDELWLYNRMRENNMDASWGPSGLMVGRSRSSESPRGAAMDNRQAEKSARATKGSR